MNFREDRSINAPPVLPDFSLPYYYSCERPGYSDIGNRCAIKKLRADSLFPNKKISTLKEEY